MERRTGLRFDGSTKSSDILKDLLIIQKRKLKMTYFLLKQWVWGHGGFTVSRNFSRELEFDLPRIKGDTHEGFCSWSKAPPCVPTISWVYSVLNPQEQNSHPAKCSTIFNWLNIWEQAPRANWVNLKTFPRVYCKMSLEHAPGAKPLVCISLKTLSHYISCCIDSPFENSFSSLVLPVKSTVFLCLTQRS